MVEPVLILFWARLVSGPMEEPATGPFRWVVALPAHPGPSRRPISTGPRPPSRRGSSSRPLEPSTGDRRRRVTGEGSLKVFPAPDHISDRLVRPIELAAPSRRPGG